MTRTASKEPQKTILFVDDQPPVANAARDLLRLFGYEVFVANRGDEAIEIFRERSDEVNLIIFDLMMPDMGGEECLRRIREIRPDVPAVVSSGYVGDKNVEEVVRCEIQGILAKPFCPEALRAIVNKALAQ